MDSYANLGDDEYGDFSAPARVPQSLLTDFDVKEFAQEDLLPPFMAFLLGILGIPFGLCECVWCAGCCSLFLSRTHGARIVSVLDSILSGFSWIVIVLCTCFNCCMFITSTMLFALIVVLLTGVGGGGIYSVSGSFSS